MSDDDDKSGGVTVNLPLSGKVLQTLPEEDRRAIFQPLVALGKGLGRLIERKFEEWNEDERSEQLALIADASSRAGESVKTPNKKNLSRILDASTSESDANVRELWTNLLANELQSGTHPDFISVLDRMNHEDAFRLLKIAERQGFVPSKGEFERQGALAALKDVPASFADALSVLLNLPWQKMLIDGIVNAGKNQPTAREKFIDEHLVDLQLIQYGEKNILPRLTYTGKEFLKAVSDPSLVVVARDAAAPGEETPGEETPAEEETATSDEDPGLPDGTVPKSDDDSEDTTSEENAF